MKKVNKIIVIAAFLANSLLAFSQMDTAFWFVAPDATSNHDQDTNIGFMITSTYSCSVTISQPDNPAFLDITVSPTANSVTWVPLYSRFAMVENTPPDAVLNKGIFIHSTSMVTIYYEKAGDQNNAIFNLKGHNALGTNFIIPRQSKQGHVDQAYYAIRPKRGFDIVASKDNTIVTITPSQDIVGHLAGIPFNITLNKGQTYSAIKTPIPGTANEPDAVNQGFLEGTTVISDSAIAITLFDDSQYCSGGYDLTGDQIFPTSIAGKEYIGVKGQLYDYNQEYIFITAIYNGTNVYNAAGTLLGTINKGQTLNVNSFIPAGIDPSFLYIRTNFDAYAYQLTGNGKEATASILPPIDRCTGSQMVGFTRSALGTNDSLKFFANILVQRTPAGADTAFKFFRNGILIPDVIKATDFVNINADWKAGRIDLTSIVNPNNACVVTNDISYFHLGIFNAGRNTAEYGYFSDLNPVELEAYVQGAKDTNYAVTCSGTPLILYAVASGAKEYVWSPGKNLNDSTVAFPIATIADSGTHKYKVRAKICSLWDTAEVVIKTVLSAPTPISDTMLACFGSPIQPLKVANYDSGATLVWYSDAALTDSIRAIQADTFNTAKTAVGNYIYYVKQMHDPHCKSAAQRMVLNIDSLRVRKAGDALNANICSNENIDLFTTIEKYNTGGTWIDSMQTGKVSGSMFNAAGIKGGSYQFVYTFDFMGCPVDSVITTVTTDIFPPDIKCRDTINRTGGSLGNAYQVGPGDNFGPISVSDNCQFTLTNNINYDSVLTLTVIQGSTIITWVAIDSGMNMASCNTIFNLETLDIPNTITPNGDGHNDFFDISFEAGYPDAVLEIFDRWGKKIFVSQKGYPDKWYGTISGSLVPIDTYQYVVRNGTDVVQKGFISVVY